MVFAQTNKQEDTTTFDTYTYYTLWHSGCTHSINTYYELYTNYKLLEKGNDTEINDL